MPRNFDKETAGLFFLSVVIACPIIMWIAREPNGIRPEYGVFCPVGIIFMMLVSINFWWKKRKSNK
jgi:hypothetical protein